MEIGDNQPTRGGRARPWLIASTVAFGWAILTFTVLHIVSNRNPILDTLSSYTLTDRGDGMFPAGLLSLSVGSLALLGALTASNISISRTTSFFFATCSMGLILAAIFPASYPESPNQISGEIHQYSCVIAFLSVPAIGWSIAERLRETSTLNPYRPALLKFTAASAASLGLFGVSYILAAFPQVPFIAELSTIFPVGLTQRVALIVDIALLGWLLLFVFRTATANQTTSTWTETTPQLWSPVDPNPTAMPIHNAGVPFRDATGTVTATREPSEVQMVGGERSQAGIG